MREDFATRLLVRHLREVAQTLVGGGEIGRGLLLGGGNGGLLRLHCGGLCIQLVRAPVEGVLALRKSVLYRLKFGAALLGGRLELLLRLHDRGAGRDVRLLQLRLDLAFAFLLAKAHLLLNGLRAPASDEPAQRVAEQDAEQQQHRDDNDRDAVRKEAPRAAPGIAGEGCKHGVSTPPSSRG